jgi:SAM-dependent methyltransferase
MSQFYPTVYHARLGGIESTNRSFTYRAYAGACKLGLGEIFVDLVVFHRRGSILRRFLRTNPSGPQGSSLLDVGCGTGTLLAQLAPLGFGQLEGVDPYAEDRTFLDGRLRIRRGVLDVIPGKFDYVVLNHSIEHVPDQLNLLVQVRSRLKENGAVLVRTPVADSTAFRRYGRFWYQLDPPRHVLVHTVRSMRTLAARTGFEITEVIHDSGPAQFWRSELARRGIPQESVPTWHTLAEKFPDVAKIRSLPELERDSHRLNETGLGDQAAFILRLS